MMNDIAPELGRRKRAAWGAYKSIEDAVKKTKNTGLRAHLFNTTLPEHPFASYLRSFYLRTFFQIDDLSGMVHMENAH
ncbi:hypothetical protein ANCCEY_04946 [Ancylostoma ceylanicum]|uniref:Uncharacterized protein n=1 Tax=Ancylostoma ceylanicum TaxID=53326 RepID=A0A0D6M0V5_9BILA|nr:hypothetical protein ANCCEY_04946 [Ancylostoma ceylanicum]